MKKFKIFFIVFLLIVNCTVFAYDDYYGDDNADWTVIASGYCGDEYYYDEYNCTYTWGGNLTWILYESGRLVISGSGGIGDKYGEYGNYCENCWQTHRLWEGHYAVGYTPENEYGDYEYINPNEIIYFGGMVKSIEFSGDITSIGMSAFMEFTALESIEIPESVTMIDSGAFKYCTSLTSITIPSGVTSLDETFMECTSLETVVLPDSVSSITGSVFTGCTSLSDIQISEDNPYFTYDSESGCILTADKTGIVYVPSDISGSFEIPEGVTTIADNLFYGNSKLTSVTIPDSVTKIGSSAFAHCTKLENVTMSKALMEMGDCVFLSCSSLTEISLPDTLTTVGYSAFSGCEKLSKVTLSKNLTEISESMFSYCSSLAKIDIPESVTKIGSYAFKNTALTEIELPNGLKTIGDDAFYGTNITKFTLPDGIESVSLSGTNITEISLPESVTSVSFNNCTLLKSVEIPNGVKGIGQIFSGCTSLESVTLPESIEYIGSCAFSGCTSLSEINIPISVTSIGYEAFYNCSSLKAIEIPSGVTGLEWNTFSGCSSLESVTLPESIEYIGSCAFSGCTSLKAIEIPESITEIGSYTFSGCSSLEKVILPEGLLEIYEEAFSNCTSLSEINLPDSLTYISQTAFKNVPLFNPTDITEDYYISNWLVKAYSDGEYYRLENGIKIFPGAFKETNITYLYMDEDMTKIPDYAFSGMTSLMRVEIPAGVKEIGTHAFSGCTGLEEIYFQEGYVYEEDFGAVWCKSTLETIGYNAFEGCTSLENIELLEGLKNIKHSAFKGCESITNLIIPDSIESVERDAFADCTGLNAAYIPRLKGSYYVDSWTGEGYQINYYAFGGNEWDSSDKLYIDTIYYGGGLYSSEGYSDHSFNLNVNYGKKYDLYGGKYDLAGTLYWSGGSTDQLSDEFCQKVRCIKIRDGIKSIGSDYAMGSGYWNFVNLRGFVLPEGLEQILGAALPYGGDFYIDIPASVNYIYPPCGGDGLLGMNVSPLNENYYDIDGVLFKKDGTLAKTFYKENSYYEIPEGTKKIGDFAIGVQNVVIPKSVTEFGHYIWGYSWDNNVYYKGTRDEWNAIVKGEGSDFSVNPSYDGNCVHYNYGIAAPESKCSYYYGNEMIKLSVTLPDIEIPEKAVLFAMGTTEVGDIISTSKTLENDEKTAELSISPKAKNLKVFVWESLDSLRPLAAAEELDVFIRE